MGNETKKKFCVAQSAGDPDFYFVHCFFGFYHLKEALRINHSYVIAEDNLKKALMESK